MIQRRKFIKQAAIGAAVVTAAAAGIPQILTRKKKDRLGVALVGLGYYSTDLLAPALQLTQNCYLAGIVTGSPEKAERWKKQHKLVDKNIYNYDNFDKIADNPDIDVVYVVLPPVLHREYTVRAANAGKHVWCEKPMAMTAAECEAMIKACADNKVKLAIGYRMQHEPNTQEIIGYGRNKTFGKVKLISVAAGYFDGRTDHWKQNRAMGGGAMFDMGVYSLNAARYVAGEEPVAVLAQEKTTRPEIYNRADETTIFQLEFPSGALANCATSLGMNMNYLNVTAEQGWYKLEPFQSYSGIQGASSKGTLNLKIPNQQAKQMDDDALAIMNGTAMLVPGEEGRHDIKVVEAIHLSATEGRRVVI
ncbi:MAG TPA: Gfo/Idh/MocA family oxidoreductase [Saprospiraceae bacterium]|nr:Gfo/Idh/MocA family oxidoreductase [Saprospiraceae bacterium]